MPRISIIVAVTSKTRAIGNNNELLFRIPDDLKRFKSLTSGHTIIMGRKTYESIGRPLPNRNNIVISRNTDFKAEGCVIVPSLEAAIAKAKEIDHEEIFIIGGGEIYKEGITFADRLYITVIESDMNGDVIFPEYEHIFSKIVSEEVHLENSPPYRFLILEK